jgi:ubiquinone/menaquinone biosynthesis C-methylase UbiE
VDTGKLVELKRQKFNKIQRIDIDEGSIRFYAKRFENNKIFIKQGDIDNLKDLFEDEEFDYVTSCDGLGHIRLKEATKRYTIFRAS